MLGSPGGTRTGPDTWSQSISPPTAGTPGAAGAALADAEALVEALAEALAEALGLALELPPNDESSQAWPVTRSYVSNLRKGRIENPGFEKLRALAKAINFPPEAVSSSFSP